MASALRTNLVKLKSKLHNANNKPPNASNKRYQPGQQKGNGKPEATSSGTQCEQQEGLLLLGVEWAEGGSSTKRKMTECLASSAAGSSQRKQLKDTFHIVKKRQRMP